MKYNPDDYEFAIRVLHHRQELSDKEVREWMEDPGHVKLLEEMACIRMISGLPDISGLSGPEDIPQRGRSFKIFHMSAIAASILLVFFICSFFLGKKREANMPTAVNTLIEPGGIKARLILGNGQVVELGLGGQQIPGSVERIVGEERREGLKYLPIDTIEAVEEMHILQVPLGGFYKLQLSDGTKVWLNAGTELRYPVQFTGKKREVSLKGEGYFEVTENRDKCFQVHLDDASITVLGTSFNVSAYPEEKGIFTTLVNGKVRFQRNNSPEEVMLHPGEQCVMDKAEGSTSVSEVDTGLYTAWLNGRFVFRDMPLEAIMRQLERWYDFRIVYLQPEIKQEQFRGVIQRDSKIEDVFRAIELTTEVKFQIEGKKVTVMKK